MVFLEFHHGLDTTKPLWNIIQFWLVSQLKDEAYRTQK